MEVVANLSCPPLLTKNEVAGKLRISLTTLNKLISESKLSTVPIGRRRLISEEQLMAFIQKGGSK